MPKEKIISALNCPDGPQDEVTVGWARGAPGIEIGVGDGAGRTWLWRLYGSEANRINVAKRLLEYVDGLNPGEVKDSDHEMEFLASVGADVLDMFEEWAYSHVSVSLDRNGCNGLIKAVRRARDQAFGRDE